MNDQERTNRYVIRHPIAEIIFAVVTINTMYHIWSADAEMLLDQVITSAVVMMIYSFMMLSHCRGFILDAQGITLTLFGLPMRKMEWSRVRNVILVHRVQRISRGLTRGALLVIPKDCPSFRIGEDRVWLYSAGHILRVFSIRFSPRRADAHGAAVRRFFGSVKEIQEHF